MKIAKRNTTNSKSEFGNSVIVIFYLFDICQLKFGA